MNTTDVSAPWHAASFERFTGELLPELLARRIPLASCTLEQNAVHTVAVTISVPSADGVVQTTHFEIPAPDSDGIFHYDGRRLVVPPRANGDELETATISCVGEQLLAEIDGRLGEAPTDLQWDENLLRAWFPLDEWVRSFLARVGQPLEETNWLSAKTHLRRIFLPASSRVFLSGHYGRVCPIETPEGPNIGRVLSVSIGAEISDGRLQVLDPDPVAGYGLTVHMTPFLEHDEPARLLMGVNMMRQWLTPPDPEPALVQTGCEPDVPEFWCGRNLLTAFVSWGVDSFEDGIVISESAAARLGYPAPIEAGDKLSNRHGSKGVVSCILPDSEMPQLEDGRAIDLVFDCMGLFTRMNFGLVREAVAGLIAHTSGTPEIIPPFAAPPEADVRTRLEAAGLPDDGQTQLYAPATSHHHIITSSHHHPLTSSHPPIRAVRHPLDRRSTVGYVYWGKLDHRAENKIQTMMTPHRCQRQGSLEYYGLLRSGAFEFIREQYNTRAADRADAASLSERVALRSIGQAKAPTPRFADLTRRLAAAGIAVDIADDSIRFRLAAPEGEKLELAQAIAHPWLPEENITTIGACSDIEEYAAVVTANRSLERILETSSSLTNLAARAVTALATAVAVLFDALVGPEHLRFASRVQFSARAVAAPGRDLRHDEVILPNEIAWALFGPQLIRELGPDPVAARNDHASDSLDAMMKTSWVVIHRAPALEPTGMLAFRPRREPGRVIRIPTMTNELMNADFDGDILAVFLPLTDAAQQDAGERLTIAGHLRRDPGVLAGLLPLQGARYGLALLGRTPSGISEISEVAGVEVKAIDGIVGRQSILNAVERILQEQGVDAALSALERLNARGFEVSRRSGLSLPPMAPMLPRSIVKPESDSPGQWERYLEETTEQLLTLRDQDQHPLFPFLLVTLSGARGSLAHVPRYVASFGLVENAEGKRVPIRHSLIEGVTPVELGTMAVGSRRAQAAAVHEIDHMSRILWERFRPTGLNVLDRAMRSRFPGVVLARAAASEEMDPLASIGSRLFVGL